MLGVRVDSDQFYLSHSVRRTSSFANKLTGRFFVSGVSGGFEKYDRQQQQQQQQPTAPRAAESTGKYTYQPVLERNQREALRRDAQRLIELEQKLNEIQRIKERRRSRDRERNHKRKLFQAVTVIQRMWRTHLRRRRQQATHVIVNFLKALKAQQAVYTATWALAVMQRSLRRMMLRWQRRRAISLVAEANVNAYLSMAIDRAAIVIQQERDIDEDCNKKKTMKKKLNREDSARRRREREDYLQFFLTEFENEGGNGSDDESVTEEEEEEEEEDNDEQNGEKERTAQVKDVDSPHGSLKRTLSRKPLDRSTSTKASAPQPSDLQPTLKTQLSQPNVLQSARYLDTKSSGVHGKHKQYDLEDRKVKKLIEKHKETERQMLEEQRRRQQLIEQSKKSQQERKQHLQQQETEETAGKAKAKTDFFRRLEEMNAKLKRTAAKQREDRKREESLLLKEKETMKRELRMMFAEDVRLKAKMDQVRRHALAARQMKTAAVDENKGKAVKNSRVALSKGADGDDEINGTKPQPDEEKGDAEGREAERLRRFRDNLQQRLRKQKQQREEEERMQRVQEQSRKAKLAEVLHQYEVAVQLKKQELLERKRRERREKRMQRRALLEQQQQQQQQQAMQETNREAAEEEDDDALLDEEPKSNRVRVISSAREEYGEKIEDFHFDEFIAHSLTVYHPEEGINEMDEEENGENEEEEEDGQDSANGKIVPEHIPLPLPPKGSTQPDRSEQAKKLNKANGLIKKLPQHLKTTPYFTAFVRQTGADKFLNTKPTQKAPKAIGNPSKVRKGETRNHGRSGDSRRGMTAEMDSSFARFDLDNEDNDSVEKLDELMAMVERAKQKLFAPQPSTTSFHSSDSDRNVDDDQQHDSGQQQVTSIGAPPPLPLLSLPSGPPASTSMASMNAFFSRATPAIPQAPQSVSSICQRHGISMADCGFAVEPSATIAKRKVLPSSVAIVKIKPPKAALITDDREKENKRSQARETVKAMAAKNRAAAHQRGIIKFDKHETKGNTPSALPNDNIVDKCTQNDRNVAHDGVNDDDDDDGDSDNGEELHSGRLRERVEGLRNYELQLRNDYEKMKLEFDSKLTDQLRQSKESHPVAADEQEYSVMQRLTAKELLAQWELEDQEVAADGSSHLRSTKLEADRYDREEEDEDPARDSGDYDERVLNGVEEDEEGEGEENEEDLYYDRQVAQYNGRRSIADEGFDGSEDDDGDENYYDNEDNDGVEEEDNEEEEEDQFHMNAREKARQWSSVLQQDNDNDDQCLEFLHSLSRKMISK